MLQTHRTSYRSGLPLDVVGAPLSLHLSTGERLAGARHRQPSEFAIDDALAAPLPASDRPGWNPGLAKSGSINRLPDGATDIAPMPPAGETGAGFWDVIEVSRGYDSERTLLQALSSLAGGVGIALVVPFAILLLGLPIALGFRGLLEVLMWLVPGIR